MHKAPGRSERNGITLFALLQMFPDEEAAERWFEAQRWADGERACPKCGCMNTRRVKSRKPMPFWCKDCRSYFSLKTATVMADSNLGLRTWAFGMYLMATNLKGVSSMKLHRDLGISQPTAWFMAQRLREGLPLGTNKLTGIVEVDETCLGGKESNKHASKKLHVGGGTSGKATVMGRSGPKKLDSFFGPLLMPTASPGSNRRSLDGNRSCQAFFVIPNTVGLVVTNIGEERWFGLIGQILAGFKV